MKSFKFCIAVIAASLLSLSCLGQESLHVPQISHERDQFAVKLLNKALSYSNSTLLPVGQNHALSVQGKIEALKHQDIDVAWLAYDDSLNSHFITIKIPIYKGALSYYQLITQKALSNIPFDRLRALTFGMLRDDAKHAQLNALGLDVVTAPNLNSLEAMLSGERFDIAMVPLFATRKPDSETEGLLIPPVIISSLNPYYFYLDKSNPVLARKIEQGLMAMHKDGSMAQMFYDEPWVDITITELESGAYEVMYIEAPTTVLAAKQIDKEYWLNLKQGSLFTQLF